MNKNEYIGDGFSCRIDNNKMVLTKHTGLDVHAEVFIEPFVFLAIIKYALKQCFIKMGSQ